MTDMRSASADGDVRERLMVTPGSDRLAQAKSRPGIVAEAIRTAVRDAVGWRIGGGAAPTGAALVGAAVASARLSVELGVTDFGECSRILAAVRHTAQRFARSPLCNRLLTVPASRFVRLPRAERCTFDVLVRDRRGRLHAIVFSSSSDVLDAGRLASQIATTTSLPAADRLAPVTIHVYSLAAGTRRSFERQLLATAPSRDRHVA